MDPTDNIIQQAEASLQLARQYRRKGDFDQAIQAYWETLLLYEQADDPQAIVIILEEMSSTIPEVYYPLEMERIRLKQIEAYQRIADSEQDSERANQALENISNIKFDLWYNYFKQGELEKSRIFYKEVQQKSDSNRWFEKRIAQTDKNLLSVYGKADSLTFNEPYAENQMEIYELLAQGNTFYREKVAEYQHRTAMALQSAGNLELAVCVYLKAINNYENCYDDEFETPPAILSSIWNMALLYESNGNIEEAVKWFEKGKVWSSRLAKWDDRFQKNIHEFTLRLQKN